MEPAPRFGAMKSTSPLTDAVFAVAQETRPGSVERPWLYTNMISSADGATSIGGLSGPLGAAADVEMLVALRSMADVILAGSGTVSTENYGPAQLRPSIVADRVDRGQSPVPTVAIVSARLSIDPAARIFSDPEHRPILVTCSAAPPDRLMPLAEVSDIIVAGDRTVDLGLAVDQLGASGASLVLSEGGPTLNGHLLAEDLLDEWNITYAPVVAGGDSRRAAVSELSHPARRMTLDRVWTSGHLLFCRYLRDRSQPE